MKLVMRVCFILLVICSSFFMWITLDQPPHDLKKNPSLRSPQEEETGDEEDEQERMVHMKRKDGSEVELELETYLIGVVASEMKASFAIEALKAQAVAARTFVVQRAYEVDDSTSSQVYQDDDQLRQVWGDHFTEYHDKVAQAVNETKGKVITYQGNCITAAFFSSSNGYTNNSEDYWKTAQPYLRSVESSWDLEVEGNVQDVRFTREEMAQALGFSNAIGSIDSPERYANGYVKTVTMDGINFTGREIREALSLRSSAFEITVDGDTILFTTHGFGHGIGMSQYGAEAMAQAGSTYEEIIQHYYTGVEITDL